VPIFKAGNLTGTGDFDFGSHVAIKYVNIDVVTGGRESRHLNGLMDRWLHLGWFALGYLDTGTGHHYYTDPRYIDFSYQYWPGTTILYPGDTFRYLRWGLDALAEIYFEAGY